MFLYATFDSKLDAIAFSGGKKFIYTKMGFALSRAKKLNSLYGYESDRFTVKVEENQ